MFDAVRLEFEIINLTRQLPNVDFDFIGSPYGYQMKAWNELSNYKQGILVGPIGCGKKVTALSLMAKLRVPTLVVVSTKRRLAQWHETALRFLSIPDGDIGIIGCGKREMGRKLTLSITLSLWKPSSCIKNVIIAK